LEFEGGGEELAERARRVIGENGGKVIGNCPTGCGGKVYAAEEGYFCERMAEKKCLFYVGKRMLSHVLKDEEVQAMIGEGKTPLIADFISNRTGKSFSAFLRAEPSGKISFEFPPREPRTSSKKARNAAADSATNSTTGK
jgi:DNA topoisomerase-3